MAGGVRFVVLAVTNSCIHSDMLYWAGQASTMPSAMDRFCPGRGEAGYRRL